MNYKMIGYTLGWMMLLLGAAFIVPFLVAVYTGEAIGAFLVPMLVSLIVGCIITVKKPKKTAMYAKDSVISVAVGWLLISVIGAVPFMLSGSLTSFVDALFESSSGFTTTGASVIADVESLPRAIQLWRSVTNWLGGLGVLVVLMAVVPKSGNYGNMFLMRAESPGPTVDKIVPRARDTAAILLKIYITLTVLAIICLLLCGLKGFDAVNAAMATAGTGGFSIKNASIGAYSPAVQVVVGIFMVLFAVNFNIYYLLRTRRFSQVWKSSELRTFFCVIAAAVIVIAFNVRGYFDGFTDALRAAFFQVASIISSTGFATADFNLWPAASKTILVILMFMGACAGSTGGGMKVSRVIIAFKTVVKELVTIISPRSLKKVKFDSRMVEHETIRAINVFVISYFMVIGISVLIISFFEQDLTTNFVSVVSAIGNMGPGLGITGPAGNYSSLTDISKLVLIFDMIAGRLELFPMMVLLSPTTWHR